jgi:hypothetical protein
MAAKTEIGQLMRDAIQRGRAAERVKGLAALSLVVREYPDNLVAFLCGALRDPAGSET